MVSVPRGVGSVAVDTGSAGAGGTEDGGVAGRGVVDVAGLAGVTVGSAGAEGIPAFAVESPVGVIGPVVSVG